MRKKLLVLIFILTTIIDSYSQDPQFSQYYSAPLILNPAMAGATECYRAGLNARSQWTGLPGGAFNTASAFIDLSYYQSGFGLLFLHDVIGTPRMSSTEVSGFYAHLIPFSKLLNFRLGLQATYVNRGLDYSRLIFEDQFTGITVTDPRTDDPVSFHNRVHYPDFSAGMLMFGEEKYWLGFSAHHLTRPEQSFYKEESILPIKYSIHGGWNIFYTNRQYLRNEPIRIVPTFIYKAQGRFDQLDLGVYGMKDPFLLGFWYRGIMIKQDERIINSDALIAQFGFQYNSLSITYSYDFTVSRLDIRNTHGSHEISLIYLFCLDWPPKKRQYKHARKLPCPDFQRSLKYKGDF